MSAAQVIDTLADCSIQLGTIHKGLARWELGDLTAEALVRVGQKQAELLGASPPEVAAWGPVATEQRRRLHAIGDALRRIDQQVGNRLETAPRLAPGTPVPACAGQMEFFSRQSKRALAISPSAVSGFVASDTNRCAMRGPRIGRCSQKATHSGSYVDH